MCVDHKVACVCGKNSASFNFKDDLLPSGALSRLFCPACSPAVGFNPGTMLADNGWIIEYDMDMVRLTTQNISRDEAITPEFLFDEGYCSWRGIYPGDQIDSARERAELLALAKTDRKRYFEEIKTWGINRMQRLARDGWRKANESEPVGK